MQKPKKKWKDALFCITPQVHFQKIKYLDYFFVEIIIKIQSLISIKHKIQINLLLIQLKVSIKK